jgi:hypothetical protein
VCVCVCVCVLTWMPVHVELKQLREANAQLCAVADTVPGLKAELEDTRHRQEEADHLNKVLEGMVGDKTEVNSLQEEVASKQGEIQRLEEYLEEAVSHIGRIKAKMEEMEEFQASVEDRLRAAVAAGVITPVSVPKLGSGPSSKRRAITVSIPSVVVMTSRGKEYHAYEIIVAVGDDHWKIHRRYSEILELRNALRTEIPGTGAIPFPPKKSIGNRKAKVAEDRRLKLQVRGFVVLEAGRLIMLRC